MRGTVGPAALYALVADLPAEVLHQDGERMLVAAHGFAGVWVADDGLIVVAVVGMAVEFVAAVVLVRGAWAVAVRVVAVRGLPACRSGVPWNT